MKKAPLKEIKEELGRNGFNFNQEKCSNQDWRAATALINAIRMIEDYTFGDGKKTKINIFMEANGRGIEANFYPWETEYDIYLPGLGKKFKETKILFPDYYYLKNDIQRAFFIAAHKVRHRIQTGGRVKIFTPYHQTENEWIKKLIQKIKNPNDHDSCSCSILQDKTKARLQLLEFDALVIQHMITSRFWLLNGASDFSEIPQFFLRAVTRDLLTDA